VNEFPDILDLKTKLEALPPEQFESLQIGILNAKAGEGTAVILKFVNPR
jgi:hypothetical protein